MNFIRKINQMLFPVFRKPFPLSAIDLFFFKYH